jgi:hypothetical protein
MVNGSHGARVNATLDDRRFMLFEFKNDWIKGKTGSLMFRSSFLWRTLALSEQIPINNFLCLASRISILLKKMI